MGLDAQFMIKPLVKITDEQFKQLRQEFYEKFPDPYPTNPTKDYRFPELRWSKFESGMIDIVCTERYYGKGYERGRWPLIQEMGDWLAIKLGELAELRYGNDCNAHWEIMDQWGRIRNTLTKHWEKYRNEPYRQAFRDIGILLASDEK